MLRNSNAVTNAFRIFAFGRTPSPHHFMQTPAELCPHVKHTKDRNVFTVKSRSGDKNRIVNAEARFGLMSCDCPDFQIKQNPNCYHVQLVRKYIACKVMQAFLNNKFNQ